MKEEDKITVKTEADSVDDVQFPSTCTGELINVKREITEATAFVGVKAETDNEVSCYRVGENSCYRVGENSCYRVGENSCYRVGKIVVTV